MYNPKTILDTIPDKFDSKTTTSKRFKTDLYNFIVKNGVRSILEIGSSVGHTAYFLGHFVDTFSCVELDRSRVDRVNKLCENLDSVVCYRKDVYRDAWDFKYHDMIIIDCVHYYKHVKSDIENALKLKPIYLVFDDYGLIPEVKRAVDEYVDRSILQVELKVGHPMSTEFYMCKSENITKDKRLADSEGIICKVL